MITCLFKRPMRGAVLLLIGVGLSACAEMDGASQFSFLSAPGAAPLGSAKAITEARLAGSNLTVESPSGWCIERRGLRNKRRESFAFVAGCRALTRNAEFEAVPPGYATVSVGPRQDADLTASDLLAGVITTPKNAILTEEAGFAVAQMAEKSAGPRWRVAAMIDQWPVLISVHGDAPDLAGARGKTLAIDLAGSIVDRHANDSLAEEATPAAMEQSQSQSEDGPTENQTEAASKPDAVTDPEAEGDVRGFFRRLLN